MHKSLTTVVLLIATVAIAACNRKAEPPPPAVNATALSADEARSIAKDAYIYGFPLVDSYRVQYAYFVDNTNPEYKSGWNELTNTARVYTPDDKAIQTPNSDTPYSSFGADLRAEPLVITVPAVDPKRYYSVQLIDAYTFNFAYIGSRATGNGAGRYLLAGPDWKGETPPGIAGVLRAETDFVFALYRTQLFNPADLDEVKKVQAGYQLQTLSAYLGQPPPPAAPAIDFPKPLSRDEEKTSIDFFKQLDFVLRYCPVHPAETELRARFARLGIGGDKPFDAQALSPELRQALQQGIADAWQEFAAAKARVDAGEITSAQMLGDRDNMKGQYINRMLGAALGIYGNSQAEAMYPVYALDADGKPFDGSSRYTVHFAPGQLPPVKAFWSMTMYEMPQSLLYANPLNRYLINSPMLPQLKKDADGGITLYIQHESPGKAREANWLPAPAGPFVIAMRLYWPKDEALQGQWKAPPAQRVP